MYAIQGSNYRKSRAGDTFRETGGWKFASGVKRWSSGRRSGGRIPAEPDALWVYRTWIFAVAVARILVRVI